MTVFSPNFGHFAYPACGALTLIAVIFYFILSLNVARARARFHILPPVTDGPPEFIRRFRVHMNTLEHMVIYLPLLWLAAVSVGDLAAALPGLFWPIGRTMYAKAYYQDAANRLPGFIIANIVCVILLAESITGIVASL